MFIITYKSGNWDDAFDGRLFATEDEDLARRYCEKANLILGKIKEFYKSLNEKVEERIYDEDEDEDNLYLKLWCKYHRLSDVNLVSYEKIEVR